MEKNTDRILWTVLVLALGVSLFLIFLPFGKATMNTVHDKLSSIVTSQVSDPQVTYMPMSAVFIVEKNQLVKKNFVGDPAVITKWSTMNWHLVPNKPNEPMYLSIAADYDIKHFNGFTDGDSIAIDFYVNADGGPGILPKYQVSKSLSLADVGKSSHGTLYERWKLPPESTDNVEITKFGINYIDADNLTIDNIRIGLEGGSFKLE